MKTLRLATAFNGDTKTSYLHRHPVQGTAIGFIDRIKAAAKSRIETYKDEAQRQRDVEQVSRMSDSQLKDIGLTQADRSSLEAGLISLAALNDLRETYRCQFD